MTKAANIKFPIKLEGYAIYNNATGMYSRGGCDPKWGLPKIWKKVSHLKNHLLLHHRTDYNKKKFIVSKIYYGCSIIDVTTGEPIDLDPYQYVVDWLRDEIETNKYRADWTIE